MTIETFDVASILDGMQDEVNAKRFTFARFLAETYTGPFAAIVACLHQADELKEICRRQGIDVDRVMALIRFGRGNTP